MSKSPYFPDKPDDVNCTTCPYMLRLDADATMHCAREPARGGPERRVNAKFFCGEHPWFVRQRLLEEQKALEVVQAVTSFPEIDVAAQARCAEHGVHHEICTKYHSDDCWRALNTLEDLLALPKGSVVCITQTNDVFAYGVTTGAAKTVGTNVLLSMSNLDGTEEGGMLVAVDDVCVWSEK